MFQNLQSDTLHRWTVNRAIILNDVSSFICSINRNIHLNPANISYSAEANKQMVWFMDLNARGFSFNYAGSKKMSVSYKAKPNYLSVIGKRQKLEPNGLNKKMF